MGTYATNTETKIALDLTKMQQGYLDRTPEFMALMKCCNMVGQDNAIDGSFQDCCENLGHTVKVDKKHGQVVIVRVTGEDKIGWHGAYFNALGPFAHEGDYAEFRCQEYGTWRYIRHGGKFIEQQAVVKMEYPPLPAVRAAKKTAKATPKRKASGK